MKKIFLAFIPAGCFLAGALCNYHNASDARDAARAFRAATETIFQNEITSSTLNLHYTLEHPENYGITDYPVTYGKTISGSLAASGSALSVEDYLDMLQEIPFQHLSLENKITYDTLLLALENEKDAQIYALYRDPLGPTIGVQAQLPILLCEYVFSAPEDIEEYLKLISQTDLYFSALLRFEKARSAAGLFMNDRNADAIIRQCNAFMNGEDPQDNLLVTVFSEKVDALSFLSASEKEAYKAQNLRAVTDHVLPAYELLAAGLETLKGTGKNENGLCYLPSGKAFYEYLVRDSTGSYLPIAAIERRIREQILADIQSCRALLQQYPSAADSSALPALPSAPEEILADLKEKMQADFPAPGDADVEIKYVHGSLEDFLSPAFYLTPPIDDRSENVIYINSAAVTSGLELYTTLAHEGYPGHLYQNLCTPSSWNPARSLFSFGGYTEGWATYVEMESYRYAAASEGAQTTVSEAAQATVFENAQATVSENTQAIVSGSAQTTVSGEAQAAAEYARLNRSVMLGISSLLDICVHDHGFTRADTAEFLGNLGIADPESADALFDAVLEAPANYLKYYLGYLSFLDLRDYCADNWPEKFSLPDFHAQILRIGPAPFPVVEKYLKLYYRSK